MSVVSFRLNGELREIESVGATRLIDALRESFDLRSAKIACDIGRCGACMVWLDGEPANACLVPLWRLEGAEITTPEGLDDDPLARLVREALAAENAFQCGYCAPGLVMSLVAALRENSWLDEDGLRAALVGHICRCTGYHSILRGALRAAELLRETKA